MAIFSRGKDVCLEAAASQYGLTVEMIEEINYTNFFVTNLVPVTIGNIVGGVFCVGLFYWVVYVREDNVK